MQFTIPQGIQRVVLVSNITNMPQKFDFHYGDLIVEFNKAVHHSKIPVDYSILKFLFVRHNREKHFFPDNFEKISTTWDNIILTSPLCGLSTEKWFKDYYKATDGKSPTSGFAVYKMVRERRPNMPIIGLGFNLKDTSTPHNPMHDWQYEYQIYRGDKKFQAIY